MVADIGGPGIFRNKQNGYEPISRVPYSDMHLPEDTLESFNRIPSFHGRETETRKESRLFHLLPAELQYELLMFVYRLST